MRTLILWLASCLVLIVADPAPAAGKDVKSTALTLTGTFTWGKKPGDLNLVLTPDPKGGYTAVFTCEWSKKTLTYTGTFTGDPKNGAFSGTATANGKRTWTFSGTATDGALSAKHVETTGNKQNPTGTFTLKPGELKVFGSSKKPSA